MLLSAEEVAEAQETYPKIAYRLRGSVIPDISNMKFQKIPRSRQVKQEVKAILASSQVLEL
jgi:hypothetical protein